MRHWKAAVGGMLGGAVGAALWALVTLITSYEVGWIAWAVGGLVGLGVARAYRGVEHSTKGAGALAVVITVLAIPAGKYATIEAGFPDDDELVDLLVENTLEEEYVVSFLADTVAEELTLGGDGVDWPPGVAPGTGSTRADYPRNVWAEAEARWAALSDQEKEGRREDATAATRANVTEQLPEIRAAIKAGAFFGSFGGMDLVFFALAMVTAYQMAGGTGKTGTQVAAGFQEALKLAMIEIMLADGEADVEEMRLAREVYANVTGEALSEEDLLEEITRTRGEGRHFTQILNRVAPHLDEQAKRLLVGAALRVAAADGEIEEAERNILIAVAAAIGMSMGDLQKLQSGLMEKMRS